MPNTYFYINLISLFIFSFTYKMNKERMQLIDDTIESLVKQARLKNVGFIITNSTTTLFQKIYGESDKTDVKTTPFIIGSITKSFTALSILKLNISLNQTLDKFDLGDYIDEKFAKKTTISELLNHTSGLDRSSSKDIGTKGKFNYSNYGYALLGKIIENVSKKKYSEFIQENIFTPLKMTHSHAKYDKNIIDSYDNFFGFTTKYNGLKSEIGDGFYIPAGYISVSIEDMGQYLRFYLDPENNETYISKIVNESVEMEDYNSYYGMGMEIIKNDIYKVYEHNGVTQTFLSFMYIYPELNIAYFIVTNTVDIFCASSLLSLAVSIENLIVFGSLNSIYDPSFFSVHFTIDIIILFIIAFPLTYLIITIVRKIKRKKYMWFIGKKGKIIFAIDIILLLILPLILIIIFYADPNMTFYHSIKDILFCLFMFCSCLILNFLLKLIYIFIFNKYCKDHEDNREETEKTDLKLLEENIVN